MDAAVEENGQESEQAADGEEQASAEVDDKPSEDQSADVPKEEGARSFFSLFFRGIEEVLLRAGTNTLSASYVNF